MNQPAPEHIEIVADSEEGTWQPSVGDETEALLETIGLPAAVSQTLRDEAVSILARCVPPSSEAGQETGLVVGYVQSGKTLSFTTASALARDNGYALVIIIAGTSIPLTEQSRRRLRNDLRIDQREDRSWRHLHNPRIQQEDHNRITTTLADWRDPHVPSAERRTVLVTVMKNYRHLANLIQVLGQVDLSGLPVLIIDDEADQAGLNNLINEGDESTTYQRLCSLKAAIPHHTLLQYTATPQGPLLINLIDVLSPGFAVTLSPGPDYTGGQEFFLGQGPLLRVIPDQEIPSNTNQMTHAPASLLQAMRIFFLGVTSGLIRDQGRGNRSMMVHPSQRTGGHRQYYNWVVAVQADWRRLLEGENDPDRAGLLEEFRHSYGDLAATVPDLEPFDQLATRLHHAIRGTELWLVNSASGPTPQIDWRASYAHILVGGQALDRGFTVEGLSVTYMPRGVGARRADTIQQRARFFGYKRPYIGHCRVFLEQAVADAFTRYVRHEEDVRVQLEEVAADRRSLDEMRRTFLLPRGLSATRDSIIDIDYVRARVNQGWFFPRAPHDSPQAGEQNRDRIVNFLSTLELEDDNGSENRTPMQLHRFSDEISLREVYESLLLDLRFSRLSDAQNLLGVLVIVRNQLREFPEASCSVYEMSGGMQRQRALNDRGEIPNLFQGAAPVNPPERRGEIYPGDREIHAADRVTVQIHRLDLLDRDSREVIHQDVPNIAVWIPPGMAGDVLIQDQGGADESSDG